jgi:transposase
MRNVVAGIFYVLATGCQSKAMPRQFGSGSARAATQVYFPVGKMKETSLVHSSRAKMGRPTPISVGRQDWPAW